MRSGAWLWLPVALAFSACQGDYPLEPTPCDRYCRVSKGLSCYFYDPAQCVLDCERDSDGDGCAALLDATSTCFEQTPGALEEYCNIRGGIPDPTLGCRQETYDYLNCRSMYPTNE
jgi:hypothetical protein